jgi:hypothetical protein
MELQGVERHTMHVGKLITIFFPLISFTSVECMFLVLGFKVCLMLPINMQKLGLILLKLRSNIAVNLHGWTF